MIDISIFLYNNFGQTSNHLFNTTLELHPFWGGGSNFVSKQLLCAFCNHSIGNCLLHKIYIAN